MKLTVSKDQKDIKDSGGNAFINRSGIYDVVINYVQVAETKNKAKQLNFNVNCGGMDQTIYGPVLVNTDGKINDITCNMLNRLCIIAGMADGQEIETEAAEVPVGKEQKLMEMEIIPDLCDVSVKMRVQMEYSLWNNQIQERKAIKAFYREDGATAAEAESGENIGKRLALDEEKYASNVTYKDGLTEEDVKEWLQARISGANAAPAKAAPSAKAGAKRPLFNKS
jgi:hypothetical protein